MNPQITHVYFFTYWGETCSSSWILQYQHKLFRDLPLLITKNGKLSPNKWGIFIAFSSPIQMTQAASTPNMAQNNFRSYIMRTSVLFESNPLARRFWLPNLTTANELWPTSNLPRWWSRQRKQLYMAGHINPRKILVYFVPRERIHSCFWSLACNFLFVQCSIT